MSIGPVITRIVNNPKVIKFASDPTWPVAGLIITNAAFRPLFTLADPNVKPQAKKYSACREFFHQVLCLITHFTLADKFKQLGFWIGKKIVNNNPGFNKFASYADVKAFGKAGGNLLKAAPAVNGAIMFGSTLSAILALAILAPKLNNMLLPPLLNKLGVKLGDEKQEKEYHRNPIIYAASMREDRNSSTSLPYNFTASDLQNFNKLA